MYLHKIRVFFSDTDKIFFGILYKIWAHFS